MKQKIKILSDKMSTLKETKDGTLEGGFASIKGGFSASSFSDNQSCSNTGNCTHSTNTGTPACTNSGCFM